MNEKSQTMTTIFRLEMNWVNALLTWNSSDYGGISELLVRQKDVWLPDVIVKNSVTVQGQPG